MTDIYHIAIIEDDTQIRNALQEHFSTSKQIKCILAVESIDKFQKFYRDHIHIDLVLLDVMLNHTSSIYSIPMLRQKLPDAEIIMYTVHDDSTVIFQALTYGATGYLLKDIHFDVLETRLLELLNGEGALLSPAVSRKIIQHFSPKTTLTPENNELTEKETVVVQMLRDGYTYETISQRLGITINGVRYYIKSVYKKLQINSRGELLRKIK
jgi:DNA-binding NarL/FixJ family response regulator